MANLQIARLSKRFGATRAVDNVSIDIADGELVCLLGPSGSGKSTVLRMVGGFEIPSSGSIRIDGEEVSGLPAERRPTSMVFQSHALWTHMSVAANIGFGLKLRRLSRETIARKVDSALELVGLTGYGARHISQLSGGQQQRVALARSLVLEPKILLLDEPFASLDQHLRERLREEVREIQQRLKITALFVTHGQDEALALADRIVVMRDGCVEQIDRPDNIYREPQTRFVAGFIGAMNFTEGEVNAGYFSGGGLRLATPVADGPACLAVRPEVIRLSPAASADAATVHRAVDFGTHAIVDLVLPGGARAKAMTPPDHQWKQGDRVTLEFSRFILFRDEMPVYRQSVAPSGASAQ